MCMCAHSDLQHPSTDHLQSWTWTSQLKPAADGRCSCVGGITTFDVEDLPGSCLTFADLNFFFCCSTTSALPDRVHGFVSFRFRPPCVLHRLMEDFEKWIIIYQKTLRLLSATLPSLTDLDITYLDIGVSPDACTTFLYLLYDHIRLSCRRAGFLHNKRNVLQICYKIYYTLRWLKRDDRMTYINTCAISC